MKILILGVKGMAGHMIALYLRSKQYEIVGFAKDKVDFCDCIVGDALDTQNLREILDKNEFDIVVNCIGVLNQKVDLNKADGIFLNSYLPHFIAQCIKDKKTKLIHLSTDCIFSGKVGGYVENSPADSYTLYGQSKALGEVNDARNLTIRTSIIGPDRNRDGIGLMNWFLSQKNPVYGYSRVKWTGVTTLTLAQSIDAAIKQNIAGVYHLVNNQCISKYELLMIMNEELRDIKIEIIPQDEIYCDKSLVNTRVDFDFKIPSYRDMIQELNIWMQTYHEFYKHYL